MNLSSIKGKFTFLLPDIFRRDKKVNWIRLLNESMPLPDQIKDISHKCHGVIYFTWRRNTYKIETKTESVWMVNGGMLNGDDCSILIEHILKSKLK